MAAARSRIRKQFRLDPLKIKRAQRLRGAKTETETIERALDFVISEHRRNRLAKAASDRFVRDGIKIKDVYGNLED